MPRYKLRNLFREGLMRYKSCQSLLSCLRAGQARAQDSCRIGFPKTCTEVLTPRPLFTRPLFMGVLDRKRQADDTSVSAVQYDFHLAIRTGCDAVYHPGIAPHRPVVGCSLNRRPGLYRCSWMRGGRKDRARPPFLSGRSDAGAEYSGSSHPTGRSLISPPGILRRHGSGGRYRNS